MKSSFLKRNVSLPAGTLVSMLLLLPTLVSAGDIRCPEAVTVAQTGEAPDPSWSVRDSALPHWLAEVTFYSGPPEHHTIVKPHKENRSPKKIEVRWHFHPEKQETWLECGYASTGVLLSKPLPAGISECTVTYKADEYVDGKRAIEGIACK